MPHVLAAGHYLEPDGTYRVGFNPQNASKQVKLGYSKYLDNTPPDGVSINSRLGWLEEGLASVESSNNPKYPKEPWKGQFLDAIRNTHTINFLVDGIDIFIRPDRYKDYTRTHWEMDQIIQLGYTDKLQLWRNGQELMGQERAAWIDKWKEIRGLP
jgi:hypothetical protein